MMQRKLRRADAAVAAVPCRGPRHRLGRVTKNQQLRRPGRSRASLAVGILFTLWSASSSFAPQDANRDVQEAVPCFGACAAPVGATGGADASPAAHSKRGRTAPAGGVSEPKAAAFTGTEEQHSLLKPELMGIVHMWADGGRPAGRSGVTLLGDASSTGDTQAVVGQTALTAPAKKNVLPESRRTGGAKQTYVQWTDAPAFVQQQAGHGERATGSGPVQCSCELAGECLPKGSCVAIACVLVAFSILAVFLLAWLLQWLSAIPSEWILAKRFRRRSLSFLGKMEPTGALTKDDPTRPLSTAVPGGTQQSHHVQQGRGGSPDDEPLLGEQQTAPVDSLQGETGIPERYGSFATPVPKSENGRL